MKQYEKDGEHPSNKPTYEELEIRIQELEEKENYYRLIADHSTDMISKHDPDGFFLYISTACRELTGYVPEELLGRNCYDYFHPEDLSNIRESHQKITQAPIVYTVEYRFRHKRGHYVWVEATSKTIRNPDTGEIVEIIAATRDISSRKEAEDALEQRMELERTIARISTDFLGQSSKELDRGIEHALAIIADIAKTDRAYVFLVREDGLVADNTHEWCAKGIKPKIRDLQGVYIHDEFPWISQNIHDGKIFSMSDSSLLPNEAHVERKRFILKKIQSVIIVPMMLGDRLLGIIGFESLTRKKEWTNDDKAVLQLFGEIFSNAIERRRAESKLKETEARWQFALEGADEGVWDWDVPSNKVFYSGQWKKMLGYDENDIGKSLDEWESRIHPEDMAKVRRDLDRHFRGEAPLYQNEHRVLCKDGSYKWILDRGKIIERDENGKPGRVIGTHSDISERKKAEAEREKLISKLQTAISRVKTLSGLLPICSVCKKIRDDQGYWNHLEAYIHEHSEAKFSHGICPDCAARLYPELNISGKSKTSNHS